MDADIVTGRELPPGTVRHLNGKRRYWGNRTNQTTGSTTKVLIGRSTARRPTLYASLFLHTKRFRRRSSFKR